MHEQKPVPPGVYDEDPYPTTQLWTPADEHSDEHAQTVAWDAPSGAISQTFDRMHINGGAISVTAARVQSVAIWLPRDVLVSNVAFRSGSTAFVAGTGALKYFGLYDKDANQLAVSADDGSNAWGTSEDKVLAMTTPYRTLYTGRYYLAILVDSKTGAGGTQPTLQGFSNLAQNYNLGPPVLCALGNTGQSTLPTPINQNSNPNVIYYGYVT